MSFSDDDDEPPEAIALGSGDGVKTAEVSSAQNVVAHGTFKSVPVTLITGFLGAGKTTLVHHILNAEHKHRIAVIVNEYGDTAGIESAAVTTGQDEVLVPAEEWVELANGCLCCSVKSDFVAALEGLMLKRDKFDYILIETTGLADPGPVAEALWTDDELEAAVHLDAIVTVVDAKNIQRQLQQSGADGAVNEAQKQIAYADAVLLNKIDLLPSEEAVSAVEHAIHSHNAAVDIVRTTRCSLDISQILNCGAFVGSSQPPSLQTAKQITNLNQLEFSTDHSHQLASSAPFEQTDDAISQAAGSQQHQHAGHDKHDEHEHHRHHHDSDVRSVSVTCPGKVELTRLKDWLDSLLWEKGTATQDIYRMKGLVRVTDSPQAHVLQAVHELYDIVPGSAWSELPEDQQQQNRLVVIGRNLDLDALERGFKQTVE